jgi:hypothetical protein
MMLYSGRVIQWMEGKKNLKKPYQEKEGNNRQWPEPPPQLSRDKYQGQQGRDDQQHCRAMRQGIVHFPGEKCPGNPAEGADRQEIVCAVPRQGQNRAVC